MAHRHDADELLVLSLASGATNETAAASVGVSTKTVKRRKADRAFMGRVRRARAALVEESTGRMVASLNAAVLTLSQLLVDDDPGIRLKAADKLISHALRSVELIDLESRVADLEHAADPDHVPDDHQDDDTEGADDGE